MLNKQQRGHREEAMDTVLGILGMLVIKRKKNRKKIYTKGKASFAFPFFAME